MATNADWNAGGEDAGVTNDGEAEAGAATAAEGGALDGGSQESVPGGTPQAGANEEVTPDGGVADGGVADGGALDGGALDGGAPDGGASDGGAPDGGAVDGGMERELSGPDWVARFPGSRELSALTPEFAAACGAFIDALKTAGAVVKVTATLRPAERAYLMYTAYRIAKGFSEPDEVDPWPGVEINWVHPTVARSRAAAKAMVDGYKIAYAPALDTRHADGRAIDMKISWSDTLHIVTADGSVVDIPGPGTGETEELHPVGAGYGVHKLVGDPPHWSDDGD